MIVSQPLSSHVYLYLFLVNLVVMGSYLNPDPCTVLW